MLSAEVGELARSLSDTSRFEAFFALVERLSEVDEFLPAVVRNSGERGNLLQKISAAARSQRPQAVFFAANSYLHQLERLDFAQAGTDTSSMRTAIANLVDSWENYLLVGEEHVALTLLWQARELSDVLKGFLNACRIFGSALHLPQFDGAPGSTLDLRLDGQYEIHDLRAALSAVWRMYELICHLTGVEGLDKRLELVKVETGSLQVVVKGATQAIGALRRFFQYFGASALVSKRLADTQVATQSLAAQVALMRALSEEGFDTQAIGEEISEAAVLLARHTGKVVGAAEQISIDGTLVSLAQDLGLLSLPASRALPQLGSPPRGNDGSASRALSDDSINNSG